ncbi:multiprotein-bridging factor 1 family protein [Streptomyces sp. NPDC050418]|uniref:multiprotein-bridging factor 1 family protein n=1 Tax=Streptomyces sp. NPDC050418 TaxID=3365612 RepID=UPI0037A87E8D
MPGGSERARKPYLYVVRGQWPYAVMEPDIAAQVAQAVGRSLLEAMTRQELSANTLAKKSRVNRQVIAHVLAGKAWPDLMTVARLENALGVMLWPRHVDWPADGEGRSVEPPAENPG